MKILDKPIEQPWAYAYRNGYEGYRGEGPGLYFRYFATKQEAEKSRKTRLAKGNYAGKIEHRPGESWFAGYIL